MTQYELHIYGGKNVKITKDYFDTLGEAVKEAEMKCTGDTDGWEMHDGKLRLVDYNNSIRQEDLVIHKITKVE